MPSMADCVAIGVSAVHGFAHTRAKVTMCTMSMLFVFSIILIGPLLGLIVRSMALLRGGAWAIAAIMAAALAFGLVNHFLIPCTDQVSHVAEPWRVLFSVTAALLVLIEAFGSAVAVWCAVHAGSVAGGSATLGVPLVRARFMLSPNRDLVAAKHFLQLALFRTKTRPRVINVDHHPAYASAISELKESGELGLSSMSLSEQYR
jgi:hypothetical protein